MTRLADNNRTLLGCAPADAPHDNMAWISGGTFFMGSDKHYPEERPVHRVTVGGFWMDICTVTNRDFALCLS